MKLFKQNSSEGFTLIEMLVSLSLFTVVVTITVGTLLVIIDGNQQLQVEQSIMSNLTFSLDSMTRELRTGTNFYCEVHPGGAPAASTVSVFRNQESLGINTSDCDSGIGGSTAPNLVQGVSFYEASNRITGSSINRISYYYDRGNKTIMRKVGNNVAQSIIPDNISIDRAEFFVTGSGKMIDDGDNRQPAITVVIEASETGAASDKKVIIQTTVTPIAFDI